MLPFRQEVGQQVMVQVNTALDCSGDREGDIGLQQVHTLARVICSFGTDEGMDVIGFLLERQVGGTDR